VSASAGSAAERMDRIYGSQRFIYNLTRRYYLLGRTALIDSLYPPAGGHVLEIGCGTAWNLIRAAERYPDARFYGLDVSSAMLETARGATARSGLTSRIAVAQADATSFQPAGLFGQAMFDRVYFSYALSMIPDWRTAVGQAINALARGGSLHIVDFGQCEELPAAFRHLLFAWLARFSVTPIADLEADLGQLARRRGFDCHVSHLYRGYAVLGRVLTNGAVARTPMPAA
jgi:S-adenosylmethionine-diacylgycerolhomoserine-N-methlytransferase